MKTIVLLRAHDGADAPALGRWLLAELARRPWAEAASRIAVQLADRSDPAASPPFDAVAEVWSDQPLADAIAADTALAERATAEVRASDEVIGKPPAAPVGLGATPGLSQLSFIAPMDAMGQGERLRHWSEHIPLAVEIHWGMNRYVQDRLAPAGPGGSPWFGMAHLHFADAQALATGLFRSDADMAVIGADVAEFVSDYATMLATEHVLKA